MDKHIVSFSGGKDSTAMLLMMIEKNMRIDEIIFCDTGMEFPSMYDHIKKVENLINRKITILKSEKDFEYMMLEHRKIKGKNKGKQGYAWPSMMNRWCTSYLKQDVIRKYLKQYKEFNVIEYHGIAFDEPKRVEKNNKKNVIYPLFEWGITENMALEYCYSKGLDWNGLYKEFKRVSCWCCPLKSLKELKTLYLNHNDLWERLKLLDSKSWNNFRNDYTLEQLEERFILEERQIKFLI